MDSPISDLDLDKHYIIVDIHPSDFYAEFRDDLVGKTVTFSYARLNRNTGDEYYYGHVTFDEPFETEEFYFGENVFYGVKVSRWTIS